MFIAHDSTIVIHFLRIRLILPFDQGDFSTESLRGTRSNIRSLMISMLGYLSWNECPGMLKGVSGFHTGESELTSKKN